MLAAFLSLLLAASAPPTPAVAARLRAIATLMAAELLHRKAPVRLVFAAISHVDQTLDNRLRGPRKATDETWERTIEDAITWLEGLHPGEAAPYRAAYARGRGRASRPG